MADRDTPIDRFVNPYSFVSLPSRIERRTPSGHDVAMTGDGEELLYGTVTLNWTLQTPLLLPERATIEGWVDGGKVILPGASMKGVLRSTHEALFNGCPRVVDDDFVPSYRDPANRRADEDAWHVAVVTRAQHGAPKEIALCEGDPQWVEATSLKREYTKKALGLPTTSDVIELAGDPDWSDVAQRFEIRRVTAVRPLNRPPTTKDNSTGLERADYPRGARVLLATDTAARKKNRAEGTARGRAFWVTAEVGSLVLDVAEDVVRRFKQKCAGSRDSQVEARRTDAAEMEADRYATVRWWPSLDGPPNNFDANAVPVARRLKATGELCAGDVIWAKIAGGQGEERVVDLRMSVLWRRLGSGSVRDRLPGPRHGENPDLLPCRHPCPPPDGERYQDGFPDGLCLSCMIFGAADTAGEVSDRGHQDGYAGHVRVGAAVSEELVRLRSVRLAPMGQPHLGVGMFYLAATDPGSDRVRGDKPSHWGAESDTGRQLRGRKFYWHGDPDAQAAFWKPDNGRQPLPRYVARPHHRQRPSSARVADRSREAQLVPAGTTFTQRLHIDGLDRLSVGSLLAAADPGRVLGLLGGGETRRYGVHLGGGKPLGLGSVVAMVVSCQLSTAAQRYSQADSSEVSEPTLGVSDLITLRQCGRLADAAGQMIRIFDLDGLGEWRYHISYPPGAEWTQINSREFDESFVFFKEYDGEQLATDMRWYKPLRPVPDSARDSFDPTLPVAKGKRRQKGQRR